MGEQGEVSEAPVCEYHEDGGAVWARYEGGDVRLGFLVGTRDGDRIDFRYSQLNAGAKRRTVIAPRRSSCCRMDEFA